MNFPVITADRPFSVLQRDRKCSCMVLQYVELTVRREHLLVPGLMSDMSIKGPVFWIRAG